MRKRRYGLTAVAAPLGAAGAAKRAKRCTPLCRKGEGECGGCADSFGNVRPLLQLYVENYFAWWDSVQAGRRQEPLVPGRAVLWRGRAYRFQRFRTVTGDVAQCMLYDEATETFAKRVPVPDVKLKEQRIPLMPQRAMNELRFGEQEFYALHRKYRRWLARHRDRRTKAETLLRTMWVTKGGARAAEALQRLGDGGDTVDLSDVQTELWALSGGEEDEEEEEGGEE
jgi:hypothetical protein